MICYSVFGCCSTWWAEPGKQFTWISSIMNNVYGFLFHQLFWVTFYWFSVTRTKLVYLLDKKPDIWTVVVLHGLFMVICSVEHSNVDELVWVIAPLVSCASPWFFLCVCMHKNINFIAIFLYRMHFSLFIYHDCVYDYKIFITLSISI